MMANVKWDDFEFSRDEQDKELNLEHRQNTKQRKRKWREIEAVKEQQKLRREMLAYEEYQL